MTKFTRWFEDGKWPEPGSAVSDLAALSSAIIIADQPSQIARARQAPLPRGVSFLLRVASGDPPSLQEATTQTGRGERDLKRAASFFVEQVLFDADSDCYRILGSRPQDPANEIRKKMALLMRWVHPDTNANDPNAPRFNGEAFDRSIYAAKVTNAWEELKTPERRKRYDASRPAASEMGSRRRSRLSRASDKIRRQTGPSVSPPRALADHRRLPSGGGLPAAWPHLLKKLFGPIR